MQLGWPSLVGIVLPLALFVLGPAARAGSTIVIEAQYPGASAQVIEETVAAPLERQLRGIAGAARMRTLTQDGRCYLRLDFDAKTDIRTARRAALERVSAAQLALPAEVNRSGLSILANVEDSVLMIALRPGGKTDLLSLSKVVRTTIQPALARAPLVANVHTLGDTDERLRIKLDPEQLRARGLSPLDVVRRVRAATPQVSAGKIGQPPIPAGQVIEVTIPKLPNYSEIVIGNQGGKKVLLKDVATVAKETVTNGVAGIAVRAGAKATIEPAVVLIVQIAPSGAQSAPKAIGKALTDLRGKMPADVRVDKRLVGPRDPAIVLRLPDGAGAARRSRQARAAAAAAMRVPDVDAAIWLVRPGEDDGLLYLAADPAKAPQVRSALRKHLAKVDGHARVGGFVSPVLAWPGDGMDIVVRLAGPDIDELRKSADLLKNRLAKEKGIVELEQSMRMRKLLSVQVDREASAKRGVTVADIADALSLAHGGEDFARFGRTWSVNIALDQNFADNFKSLKIRNDKGEMVPLSAVAPLREESVPASLLRENGRRCLIVACNVQGRDAVETRRVVADIARELSRRGVDIKVVE